MRKKVLIQMRDLRIGNGIASSIMHFYEYTVRNGYKIDFLLNRNIESPFVNIVKRYDSSIYVLPNDTGKPNISNFRYIKRILNNGYDIIHVNISGLNAVMALYVAKKIGIKIRIYHAHVPRETSTIKARIRSLIYDTASVLEANKYVACSKYAGKSVFRKKDFKVFTNALDTYKYLYDLDARLFYRREFRIENKFVIGVVGRMSVQKNPKFIIDVFSEIVKLNPNAFLIWIGEGKLKSQILRRINRKNINDKVIFLGTRCDVNKLYSAMDIFLLPSKFEGLGLVFVEAQISGLPCFGSNKVPEDVNISPNMNFLSLKTPIKEWARQICEISLANRRSYRENAEEAGFEIEKKKDALIDLYNTFLGIK